MGPGHLGIGLAAKPLVPKVPLWVLLVASEVPDLLFFGFQAAGIENQGVTTVDFNQGLQVLSPPSIPWSHRLSMCIVWSAVVAMIAFLFCRDRRTSTVIGLMVFSHWVLDFIVYPIMPLFFDNKKKVGLGLMTSRRGFIASVILEIGLIISGIAIYVRAVKKKRSVSTAAQI